MRLIVALLCVLAVGCGSDAPVVDPDVLTTIDASLPATLDARARELRPDALADDGIDRDGLEATLDEAGYRGGVERELTGHTDTVDHVIARVLQFDQAAGARAYLDWLDGHTLDVVGPTLPGTPLAVGNDARLYELEPCGSCRKQLPTYVAAWRNGTRVGYLLVSGRGVDRATLTSLATVVDRAAA